MLRMVPKWGTLICLPHPFNFFIPPIFFISFPFVCVLPLILLIMPRTSLRQHIINRARRLFRFFAIQVALEESSSDLDIDSSSSESSDDAGNLLVWSFLRLQRMQQERYLARNSYRTHQSASGRYNVDLQQECSDSHQTKKVHGSTNCEITRLMGQEFETHAQWHIQEFYDSCNICALSYYDTTTYVIWT